MGGGRDNDKSLKHTVPDWGVKVTYKDNPKGTCWDIHVIEDPNRVVVTKLVYH